MESGKNVTSAVVRRAHKHLDFACGGKGEQGPGFVGVPGSSRRFQKYWYVPQYLGAKDQIAAQNPITADTPYKHLL